MGTHGIDWRSGSPVVDSGFYSALGIGEGHSSICDRDGNLLFYSDNDYLYNRNHQIMKNSPRFRNRSSVMCAIAPLPGNDSIYYFFSPDQYPKPAGPPYKLRYSIINMKEDNDLGEVITAPSILIDSSSEQVLLARHCNGRDWWVLCQNAVNEQFYAYLIDTGGLHTISPTISISGKINFSGNPMEKSGHNNLSHSGKYLFETTVGFGSKDYLEIHEFDPSTGRVFNGFSVFDETIDTLGRKTLFISALSADDSKLYITGADLVDAIFKWDLSLFDSAAIRQSYKKIVHELGYQLGGPILGRDDRIYLTTFSANNKNLHLIHEPNESGDACRLERNGFRLGGRSGLGIPNLTDALERPYRAVVQGPRRICRDSIAWFRLMEACPHTTEWNLPDGGNVISHLADSICISFPDTGIYRLIAAYPIRCGYKSDTLIIEAEAYLPPPPADCPTGLETSIWYMGTHGIDWRSGSPVVDSGFYSALGIGEGHSSICDRDGNLLFYTDNDYIYNRNHQIMKNSPRFLNPSSVMCAIAPHPGIDSIYYFFSPDNYPKSGAPPYKLRYSIVNMNGDNGLGEVITTPAILIDSSSEQVLLARHCNGRDWWVLCQNAVNEKFYAYLIDTGGLNINFPIVSVSGNTHNMDWPLTKRGALLLNHAQDILIEGTINSGQADFLEIHRFDPASGEVYNGFSVFNDIRDTVGRNRFFIGAISAGDSKLYITGADTVDAIFQFDISEFDSTTIRQSYKRIIHELGYQLGGPILGRDDRIYLTTFSANNKNLHLIHEPNEAGDACRLERNGFRLGGRSGLGIPNLADALEKPYRAVVQGPRRICKDSIAWYRLREACPHTTEWNLPDGGTVISHLADSICISFPDTGGYRLIAAYPIRCGYKSDTLQIKVTRCHCDHVFEWIMADTLACAGTTAEFEFKTNASDISYNGIQLDSSQFLLNHPDSLIFLDLSYPLGCDTSLQLTVKWLVPQRLDNTILFCLNDSLQIEGSYYKAGQMLRLDRKSFYGCDSTIQIQILNKRSDYSEIKLEICALDSIQISSPSGSFWVSQSDSFEIQWMNAESCDSIIHYKIIKLPDYNISQIHYKCLEDSLKLSNQWIFADTTITEFRNSQIGCDSNITWTIINFPASNPYIMEYKICEGDSVFLENNWIYQDTLIQKHYKNKLGCDSVIRHQIIFLQPSSSIQINHKLCTGDSLLISNDWYFSDTSVIFRFQNHMGCDSLIIHKVLFGNIPASADIQYELCPGQSIQIHGEEFSKDTVFNKIYLTEYGCDSIIQYRLRIHPIDTLQLIHEVVIDQGTKYTVKPILPDNYISIEWTPTEGLSCNQCPEPEITVIEDQIYYLKVTDENGCFQLDSILIRVNKKEEEFWFPMAFSPNGDHINDFWEPISSHSGSKITRISIYDRWGARIFESLNEIKAWDGTINAQAALPGVYIYLVEWIGKNGVKNLSKGEFTLIR